MANKEKRFYWMKLSVNFMTSETVDFLMSQDGGANYVVIYQMLCLKTINTDGRMERIIGEVIIPFDEAKIQRDLKWFSIDTIRVAMELYKKLGLIYEDVDGTLVIADHDKLIGSESESAERVRKFRSKQPQQALPEGDDALHCNADCNADGNENVTTEIEIRDRDRVLGISTDIPCQADARQKVISAWNDIGLTKIVKLGEGTNREKMLNARLREYGLDAVLDAIEKVRNSTFLRGQNGNGWTATFDWLVKPNNFCKVLDGNYDERRGEASGQRMAGAGGYGGTETGGVPGSGAGFSESQLRERRQREAEQRWGDLSNGNLP
jgi:hypothetical protein